MKNGTAFDNYDSLTPEQIDAIRSSTLQDTGSNPAFDPTGGPQILDAAQSSLQANDGAQNPDTPLIVKGRGITAKQITDLIDANKLGGKLSDQPVVVRKAFENYQKGGGKLDWNQWVNALRGGGGGGADGGGGTGQQDGTGTDPGTEKRNVGNDIDRIKEFEAFIQSILPGFQFDTNPTVQGDFRGNRFNAAGGAFSGGPFHAFGEEGDALAGFIANILGNEVGKQQGRGDEAEGFLRSLIGQSRRDPAAGLAQDASRSAAGRIAPGALDELRNVLTEDARSANAAELNSSLNRLSDIGAFGQGAGSRDAALQAGNLANTRLQKSLRDIELGLSAEEGSRIGQAASTAQQGANTFRAMQRDPTLALVDSLRQAQNPAVGSLAGFLNQMLALSQGKAISNDSGSFFQQAAPLIGTALGSLVAPGVGSALGGGLSSIFGGGGGQTAGSAFGPEAPIFA